MWVSGCGLDKMIEEKCENLVVKAVDVLLSVS